MATLIHLSDLHFNAAITTEEDWFKRALASLPYVKSTFGHSYQAAESLALRVDAVIRSRRRMSVPVCLVVTGDLSCAGAEAELACCETYLRGEHFVGSSGVGMRLGRPASETGSEETGLFIIPGNHDIWHRRSPRTLGAYRRHFPDQLPSRHRIVSPNGTVILYGLDTTQSDLWRHRLARGGVSSTELQALFKMIEQDAHKGVVQIVCMHHPLLDGATATEITMQLDGREAIAEQLENRGVALVLSGHVHEYFCSERMPSKCPSHIIAASATQQFESRSFAVIDVFPEYLRVLRFEQRHTSKQFEAVNTEVAFLPRSLAVTVDVLSLT